MKTTIIVLLSALMLVAMGTAGAQNVEFVGSYELPGAEAVMVSGVYAYIAASNSGLQILDVSDPSDPRFAGAYDTPDSARDVYLSGDYAYIADGREGLQIVDISDPYEPLFAAEFTELSYTNSILVYGDYAFVGTSFYLVILDISNPLDPTFVGSYIWGVSDISISDGFAYVGGGYCYREVCTAYLTVFDISDIIDPIEIYFHSWWPGWIFSLSISGNYAYICSFDDPPGDDLDILDISDPTEPFAVGTCEVPGGARSVFILDNYAYVGWSEDDIQGGLQIIDISDPSNPSSACSYDSTGPVYGVYVDDDYAYMVDQSSLIILRFDPQTGVIEDVNTPRQFALAQNHPNPFNASTSISFALPEPGNVKLTVYDLLGQQVETLLDGYRPAGEHRFTFDASDLASGLYFYRVQAGDMIETKRMVLLK